MKTTIFVFILALLALSQAQIRTVRPATTPREKTVAKIAPIFTTNVLALRAVESYLYEGMATISIQGGDHEKMSFYVTFFPWPENCDFTQCYYGYVNNFTAKNDQSGQEETLVGYGNEELSDGPVFKFETNAFDDYKLKYSEKLSPIFKEIIELACEKFNPLVQRKVSKAPIKFQSTIKTDLSATPRIRTPEPVKPEYTFRTVTPLQVEAQRFGSKISTKEEPVKLEDTLYRESVNREQLIQRDDGLIGSNRQIYSFDLGGDSEDEIANLKGSVEIDLDLARSLKLNKLIADRIVKLVEDELPERKIVSFTSDFLTKERFSGAGLFENLNPSFDNVEQPGEQDSENIPGQTYTGINVVEEFKKAKPKPGGSILGIKANIRIDEPIQLGRNAGRLLEVVDTKNIVDFTKTLYEKTIMGKLFRVNFNAKCDLIILTSDHQIRCVAHAYFKFFNQNKSLKLFDITKSVSFIWSFNKPIKGQWGSSVWIGIPKPKILGFKLDVLIEYEIDLTISAKVTNYNPYTIEVQAIANAKADTDSQAKIRVVAIEGGVFIEGTLVRVRTDPKAIAKYYFAKQEISLKAIWWGELYAFEAEWGFFYRYWRLLKNRWSNRKVIAKWDINTIYKKFKIFEDEWSFKV